ncbi:MAG: hypothetical protein H7145_21495 [Akkermansiaceae bacterium]|nr:hypothetical protein [Armatimonadota bacterium]
MVLYHGKYRVALRPLTVAIAGAGIGIFVFAAVNLTVSMTRAVNAADVALTHPLRNAGFEEPFVAVTSLTPAAVPGQRATVGGTISRHWRDRSTWADASVVYDRETSTPRFGDACQKIEIKSVSGRGGVGGIAGQTHVRFLQSVITEPGSAYRASVWLRASRPVRLRFGLRRVGPPYVFYASRQVSVGTEWRCAEVSGAVAAENAYFVLEVAEPATLYIDGAEMTRR